METIHRYGSPPYRIALLHGGPGAAGEMKPVAKELAGGFGVLELIQTKRTVQGQVEELHSQLNMAANLPAILIGHSWGAWLAFIFASRFPKLIGKLILISAGSFDADYNSDLMPIRLERLGPSDRENAKALLSKIQAGDIEQDTLRQFGRLMSSADSYSSMDSDESSIDLDMGIYQSVWTEASKLRDSNGLIGCANAIKCPVVAIHGNYDPHPVQGVEHPLSQRITDFRMIKLNKCGHTPWRETFAREEFYRIVRGLVATS